MFKKSFVLFLVVLVVTLMAVSNSSGQLTSGRWVMPVNQSASIWEDALVTGNGRHGTMVMGQQVNERIICVHEELRFRAWDRDIVAVPYLADLIPSCRTSIDTGGYNVGGIIYPAAISQWNAVGAPGVWECAPHPAFDLNIQYYDTGSLSSYFNELDLIDRGSRQGKEQDSV